MIKPFEPEQTNCGPEIDIEAIHRFLVEKSQQHNTTADPQMGGLTPEQVFRLSYQPWGKEGSPIQFKAGISLADAERSLFFRRTRMFLCAVRDAGGIKATATKNLNRKFVIEMVDVLLSDKERDDTTSYFKAPNEQDVFPLHVVRVVAQIAGLIRLAKGRFTVPKTKQAMLAPERAGELFQELFKTFFCRFELAYLNRYGPEAGDLQSYIGYTLHRIGRVAGDWHPMEGLAEEVVLPSVRCSVQAEIAARSFWSLEDLVQFRIVKPLLDWGLLEGREKDAEIGRYRILTDIRTTPLFHAFLRFDLA